MDTEEIEKDIKNLFDRDYKLRENLDLVNSLVEKE